MPGRRAFLLLILLSDLVVIGVALALGWELWLVALGAIFAMGPSLFVLARVTARIRSEANPSSEAERLGHRNLVPESSRRS